MDPPWPENPESRDTFPAGEEEDTISGFKLAAAIAALLFSGRFMYSGLEVDAAAKVCGLSLPAAAERLSSGLLPLLDMVESPESLEWRVDVLLSLPPEPLAAARFTLDQI